MAAGLQIVNRGSDGKIKQDYNAYRGNKGRVIEINKLKEQEAKKIKKK